MDDIQFWLYLLFAIIYFISRGLRKKKADKPVSRPRQQQTESSSRPRPVTFEELLKEFTEGRETPQREPEPEPEPEPEETEQVTYQSMDELAEEEGNRKIEEGRTRRFSDEESRRVYEESIALAEGASLEFERADHFKSKLQRREETVESNALASEIKTMLSDPHDVKKAVILSEILNRKY